MGIDLILYIIWFLLPIALFTMALWSKLESISNPVKKGKKDNINIWTQGLFTVICAVVAVIINEQFINTKNFLDIIPPFISPILIKLILFPLLLFTGSLLLGGSKEIKIKKK